MTRPEYQRAVDPLQEHAKLFLDQGLALLPVWPVVERDSRLICACGGTVCHSPGKHPVGPLAPRGVHSATTDERLIAGWFDRGPINLGIATGAVSGVIALDVDPRHEGDDTLSALEHQHGPLPPTWRFLTGGGGEHILFRHPGRNVGNSVGALGRGLDLRSDGGYIVAPPSRHICGRTYEISVDHHPEEIALADLPGWLLNSLARPSGAHQTKTRDWRSFTRAPITEGGRNVELTRLAGHLLRRRVDPHVALDLLLGFNALRCQPPLSEAEVVAIVASITSREHGRRHAGARHG